MPAVLYGKYNTDWHYLIMPEQSRPHQGGVGGLEVKTSYRDTFHSDPIQDLITDLNNHFVKWKYFL